MSQIRVLVVDDNLPLCQSLERWLSRDAGVAEVTFETDWRRAEEDVRGRAPDVVLLDIDMPGISGLDLIAPILLARPAAKVLMFSGAASRASVERALDNGAAGYLVKDHDPRLIADVIHRAAAGEVVLCQVAGEALMGPAAPA